MGTMHARFTYANAMATTAAVAVVLAVALIAASPAHAVPCTTVGSATGTSGSDRMCGSTGADVMLGLEGNDTMTGGDGNDTLDGGSGSDLVDGGSGDDILSGGPGINDNFQGGSGNDRVRLRDGEIDAIVGGCGSGTDSLDLDLLDVALGLGIPLPFTSCERITVGAVNEGPNVVISRHSVHVGTDGRAAVRLRCPASLPAPCAGTLRLGHSAKSQGKKTHYSIDQGEKDDVSARLSRRDRRRLRRHGETTALVTSVEQGEFGDKTTVQTIKLIAQD